MQSNHGRAGRLPSVALFLFVLFHALAPASCIVVHIKGEPTKVMPHMRALFGPQDTNNVDGNLVIPTKSFGCEKLDAKTVNGSFVLLFRGMCPFLVKAKNAQEAGARAVIIGDQFASSRLVKMIGLDKGTRIDIPAVFIKGVDHQVLRPLILGNRLRSVAIGKVGEIDRANAPTIRGRPPIYTPLIFLLLLSALPMSWCVLRIVDTLLRSLRFRLNRHVFVNFATTLPELEYHAGVEAKEEVEECKTENHNKRTCLNETCVICLEDFQLGELIKVLPCDHGFHTECIMPWFERSDACPICKAQYCQHQSAVETLWNNSCIRRLSGLYSRARSEDSESARNAPASAQLEPVERKEDSDLEDPDRSHSYLLPEVEGLSTMDRQRNGTSSEDVSYTQLDTR